MYDEKRKKKEKRREKGMMGVLLMCSGFEEGATLQEGTEMGRMWTNGKSERAS